MKILLAQVKPPVSESKIISVMELKCKIRDKKAGWREKSMNRQRLHIRGF